MVKDCFEVFRRRSVPTQVGSPGEGANLGPDKFSLGFVEFEVGQPDETVQVIIDLLV